MAKLGKAAMFAAGAVSAGLAVRAALRNRTALDLPGKVVLITGGSRGLGLALAREFAARGCRLAICSRDREELDAAARDPRLTREVFAIPCDVTRRNEVEEMVARVVDRFGRLDILVNNAGEIRVGPVESMGVRDFEDAMGVMFWGPVYSSLAALPQMLRQKHGTIVNITSIGGRVAVPHLLPYGCAKFAAVGLSEGLRAELTGTGVKVTTIVPGLMRTGSYLNAAFKGDSEREAAWFSVSAALPGITISADRAARQIVDAAGRGDAHKILTLPAKALALGHGLFPGFISDVLGWVNRYMLPSGTNPAVTRGHQAEVMHTRPMAALTVLGRMAATKFHQEHGRVPVEAAR